MSGDRQLAAQTLPATRVRRRFRVAGVVQGVGFRPFVYVTATRLSLAGSVANDAAGVLVEVEGEPAAVAEFERRLRADPPALAIVDHVLASDLPLQGGNEFHIAESDAAVAGRTLVGPDVATCSDCVRELTDPADRRYRHPFISCTNCGPRFTVITGLPYDRPTTTMAGFPLCSACAIEYADPTDRRFHAQTIACHDCGPALELVVADEEPARGPSALAAARAMLAAGAILAVKGLGGYHLVCDAGAEPAVAELRRRKRRGDKPFAVMVADLDTARALTVVDPAEAALLTSARRPIVLMERRTEPDVSVAESVAPRKPDLGILMPYTPVHLLLLGLPGESPGLQALVMTSGNLGGEPIAFDDDDAEQRLQPLVDGWLRHDRTIAVPCDDSVVRIVDGEELPLRRSRGYAPLPVALPFEVPAMLAVGADLKNTCCVAEGRYAWLSQHVGDMDDLATLDAFGTTQRHLEALTGVAPQRLVADAHPAYRSAGWARENRGQRALDTVQHHHAHVAAVMAEHGLDGTTPIIGVAFDGTGYGTDGAVWGGEVLVADYTGFRRFAHLAYVWLPGGDAAVNRPYRMALSHLAASGVRWEAGLPCVDVCPAVELDVLAHQVTSGFGSVPTSSMGRLFDAVSSLAGVRQVADYEAEAAIELEGLARDVSPGEVTYSFALVPPGAGQALIADAAPVIRAVADDVRGGVSAAIIAARFHAAVATLVRQLAGRARTELGLDKVVLGGGVFQNVLLLSAVRRMLNEDGFTVLCPHRLPPNDAGIALGQLLVAASRTH